MAVEPKKTGYVLKPEYLESYQDWLDMDEEYGCSCHLNPPCSYCTHEGNPANLEETDDAWDAVESVQVNANGIKVGE